MLPRLLYGFRDGEKERRLNRQARGYDPPRRVEPLRTIPAGFLPSFTPALGHICKDFGQDILYAGGRIPVASPQQLLAGGMKFPVTVLRRQRAGGWGWVRIDRPDGLPIIPIDAPKPQSIGFWDPDGHRLPPIFPYSRDYLCQTSRHDSPWALRACDDDWENISWLDGPRHHHKDDSGRRLNIHRHRPGGTLCLNPDNCHPDDHHPNRHHRPKHHKHSHRRRGHKHPNIHHLAAQAFANDSEISDWLNERRGARPRLCDADRNRLSRRGPPRRLETSTSISNLDDDDLFDLFDSDGDGTTDTDDDVISITGSIESSF